MIGAALALSTASAQAQLVQGNDTGGIIPWSCENEARAMKIAGDHCAWYRKYPRLTSIAREPGNYIAFSCLWDPRTAPYQIPAVRARSVCVEH
jgi:hypothetical protein